MGIYSFFTVLKIQCRSSSPQSFPYRCDGGTHRKRSIERTTDQTQSTMKQQDGPPPNRTNQYLAPKRRNEKLQIANSNPFMLSRYHLWNSFYHSIFLS